jgi:hypothetical protein
MSTYPHPPPADQAMTRIELGFFNFGIDIDLPPEYEHSHELPADPQAFWDAMIPIMRKLVESHPRTYNYQRGDRWKKRGVPPTAQAVLENFGFQYMPEAKTMDIFGCRVQGPPCAEGIPRYEDRIDRDQPFAIWFLEKLFDYVTLMTGPGFPI